VFFGLDNRTPADLTFGNLRSYRVYGRGVENGRFNISKSKGL